MTKRIGLALQGGGAHSAFTWGVLDRLLDDVERGTIEISAVSATSGGALNGAALATGLAKGGPPEARVLLRKVWETTARKAAGNPYVAASTLMNLQAASDAAGAMKPAHVQQWNIDDEFLALVSSYWSGHVSPYDVLPYASDVLEDVIDEALGPFPETLRTSKAGPELFICATNVRTNARKIFTRVEVNNAVLRASACLPNVFQTVTIDDEPYWDGGYIANPALRPLFDRTFFDPSWNAFGDRGPDKPDDVLVVRVNPFARADMPPKTAHGIAARLNEITFNASILLEAEAIRTVNKIVGKIGPDFGYRDIRLHEIGADAYMAGLGVTSKLNPYGPFLRDLFLVGREMAGHWVETNLPLVGVRSTWTDLEQRVETCLAAPHEGLVSR